MRLPMSVPAPGIFSTASKNVFGMKWVYASRRMDRTPGLRVAVATGGRGEDGGCRRPKGHAERSDVKTTASSAVIPCESGEPGMPRHLQLLVRPHLRAMT